MSISTLRYIDMFALDENEIQGKKYGKKNGHKQELDIIFNMKVGQCCFHLVLVVKLITFLGQSKHPIRRIPAMQGHFTDEHFKGI